MSERELQEQGFDDREVQRILDRAARLQQREERATRPGILRESAAEVGIRREYIDRAVQDLRAEQRARTQNRALTLWIGLAVVVVAALVLAGTYNALNRQLIAVTEARAQLENVLQRRYDLIPNLVAVAREYAGQERAVFGELAQARASYQAANTLQQKAAADQSLRAALPNFFAVAESYPQLQSSEVYVRLQDELAGTENRIAVERRRYNEAVAAYNRMAQSFPTSIARGLFGFPASQPFFEANPAAEQAPRIQ